MELLHLTRTFTEYSEPSGGADDWSDYFNLREGKHTWASLQDKPVTVVLGEAGIGKTVELGLQLHRLRKEGRFAFFFPLNQLQSKEFWDLILGDALDQYNRWSASEKPATIFLDAVDESRLRSHSDFDKALSIVQSCLRGRIGRVNFVLSSRPSDWSIEEVHAAVRERICAPIARAQAQRDFPGDLNGEGGVSLPAPNAPIEAVGPFVISLDPLSNAEAHRLANSFKVQKPEQFWLAVEDGGYHFMATRPLDLRWLVELWNAKGQLGTYRDLLDNSVANRLAEFNPNYVTAGVVPSLDRLRLGAEQLAASTEFSGRAYVALALGPSTRDEEVSPSDVLDGWRPDETERLLATAVFDEASYGRVRFHHRSIRAYLAACWTKRQLESGVPFSHVARLFAAEPFGKTVLISSRRWVLCWLAALDARTRDWVAKNHPSMLIFDGDPQAWDEPTADTAFCSYLDDLDQGLYPDWHNTEAEYRRIGLRLSRGLVARHLSEVIHDRRALHTLLSVAKFARLSDCASPSFDLYKNSDIPERTRRHALEVLESVARPEQRSAIAQDLLLGTLQTNEMISAALACVDLEDLGAEQLSRVFGRTTREEPYGGGSMAHAIKYDLLPKVTLPQASVLLVAVIEAMPKPDEGQRFARYPDSDQPERAWLLEVLTDCLVRLLELLPHNSEPYHEVCVRSALCLERMRDSGFTDNDDFARITKAVKSHEHLRWRIALEIAQSDEISHAVDRLAWGMRCVVHFDRNDVDELQKRANDTSQVDRAREVWFTVCKNIAFNQLRGQRRTRMLLALCEGPWREQRSQAISAHRQEFLRGLRARRTWHAEDLKSKQQAIANHQRNRQLINDDIDGIRSGKSVGRLQWLVHYSFDRTDRKSFSALNYEVIATDFGDSVATALRQGLDAVSETVDPPNPADYRDGRVPWIVILGLAGLTGRLQDDQAVAQLDPQMVTRAAKLAAWEPGDPVAWFDRLAKAQLSLVAASLSPWILADAMYASESPPFRGALQLALRCSSPIRKALLSPLKSQVTDLQVPGAETFKRLLTALRDDSILTPDDVGSTCQKKLEVLTASAGLIGESSWLRWWLEADAESAFAWVTNQLVRFPDAVRANVTALCHAALDLKWVGSSPSSDALRLLEKFYRLLIEHQPGEGETVEESARTPFGEHVIVRMRDSIPGYLVQVPGENAHRALSAISDLAKADDRHFLSAKLLEHAAREAELRRCRPSDLKRLADPFAFEPATEEELFVQVISHLGEIKRGLEGGPFSERRLLTRNGQEADLQNWLAAKLFDQPGRKYSLAREEEVDNDKQPDIQAAVAAGKVCIEIKPLSGSHSYSASSLCDTLKTQIVEQYLRGRNSRHGILVLFRLDDKEWVVPGVGRRETFESLLAYLNEQASVICEMAQGVTALHVLGLDCVAPAKS